MRVNKRCLGKNNVVVILESAPLFTRGSVIINSSGGQTHFPRQVIFNKQEHNPMRSSISITIWL